MKSYLTIFLLTGSIFSGIFINAQDKFLKHHPKIVVTGDETPDQSNQQVIQLNSTPVFSTDNNGGIIFDIHPISSIATGYDLQSNASTQQVWVDFNNPEYMHAFFTNSQTVSPWADRTCRYFGSTDAGVSWFELGPVPVNNGTDGRSGFPSIYGLSTGEAVLANHNNSNGSTFTHTKIFTDNSPFEYNFTEHDPGDIGDGPVWPRVVVDQNNNVVFASSGAPDAILHINTLNTTTGLFTGWQNVTDGDEAEMYDFSISDNGKIAFVYVGRTTDPGDIFYIESTDGGINWTSPTKIWDQAVTVGDDSTLGLMRGVTINYVNEDPCVAFEVGWVTSTGYYPGLPSDIRFWSPNINGGVPIVIADSSDVPFYPGYGTNDVHFPICRPVIGRGGSNLLCIAFVATTGDYWPGTGPTDSTAYYAGYFTYSLDGGNNWGDPQKFTPDNPLRDWRYPSIAEVMPSTVHIVIQGDSIPGSVVNAVAPMPVGVTAKYYHFSTKILLPGVEDENLAIKGFHLEQNYPNPFNPTTSIEYTLKSAQFISLKVYDVLGNEIATLVNEEKPAGNYKINFDASSIPSGVYFYKLISGDFSQTRKMVLMK